MKILIFHATAGHGHKKVAEVIHQSFLDRGVPAGDIKVFDSLTFTPLPFRVSYPAVYFYSVKHTPGLWGWVYETLDIPWVYRIAKPFRAISNYFAGLHLMKYVKQHQPDVIISTHFFTPQMLGIAKRKGQIRARLITVVTDYLPHSFWVNEGTDTYWVMGEEAKTYLENRGVPSKQIVAGGIPTDRKFKPSGKRSEILAKYQFSPDRFTLLMTSGSFGLGPHDKILSELSGFADKIQVFVVCGNNKSIEDLLKSKTYSFPVKIFGFVDFMPELMEASDLIIAKPGGSTATETLVKELPMIVLDPIPGQEARNAHILQSHNASFFMKEPEQARIILESILKEPALLENKKKAMRNLAKPNAAEDLVTLTLRGAQA